MPQISRRRLLGGAAAAMGSAAALSVLPPSLREAIADSGTDPGPLSKIEHVVILMQENRSFDHYFGTLAGVRGFDDPDAITLPSGRSVFYQPDPSNPNGYLLPFHLDTRKTSSQAIPSTSHEWTVQHDAWNEGAMDGFVTAHLAANGQQNGPYTMGYYERKDIPFQFALAESFTVCDNYHCSLLGPTWPNRLYLFSASIDPDGKAGGPITTNTIPNGLYRWQTYPEQLTEAGVSWHVYQEENDYGCNPLEWFQAYEDSEPGSALHDHALTIGPADQFEQDAANGTLPTVSWIIPTSQQCEHPDFLPAVGADFVASKLEAIAANKDLWAKTVFILNYDENDGLFDHVVPPTPPTGTPGEFVNGVPIGGGFRVPCLIVSPWTVGGYVAGEPFDHTSVLQFLERITGVRAANITDWRRETFGDLTSALGFSSTRPSPGLPETKHTLWQAEYAAAGLPAMTIPSTDQVVPHQQKNRSTTPVPPAPDLPVKLTGKQPYFQTRLEEILDIHGADFPNGYENTIYPGILARTLAIPFEPQADVRYAYAAHATGKYVSIINTSTFQFAGGFNATAGPYGVAPLPGQKKLYVTGSAASEVAVVDTTTATVTAHITVGLFPHGLAITPDGSHAFVANTGPQSGSTAAPGTSRTVSVIDTSTEKVAATIDVGQAPVMVAAAPDGASVYVTCDDGLYVLNAHTLKVSTKTSAYPQAHGVAVTPDGSEVWVINPRSNTVSVLDASSLRTKATVTVGRTPWNVAYWGNYAYVANANDDTVSVVDLGTHQVAATIKTAHIPVGITSAAGQVWLTTNATTNTAQCIDTSSGTIVATMKFGSHASTGIAIA